jgi:site-specific recombinase XerD
MPFPSAPHIGLKRSTAEARLDQHLTEAHAWINQNEWESTRKTYDTYRRKWEAFCDRLGIEPLHARPEHVALFMRELQLKGLAISTINGVALSAIASSYKLLDLDSPTSSKLVRAAKAVIKRTAKPPGPGKLPLPPSYLVRMIQASSGSIIDDRDSFLISLMMAAFLRESEASDLEDADVWIEVEDGIEMLMVLVSKSKTDVERRGHTIVVGAATNLLEACPIALYKRWKMRRNPDAKYLFHHSTSSKKLSHKTPNGIMKKLLERIQIDPKPYGSHSCRKGGCTAASARGINIRVLMRHGRWKSDAIFAYISNTLEEKLSVSQAVF